MATQLTNRYLKTGGLLLSSLFLLTTISVQLLAQGPPDTLTEEQNIDVYVDLLREDISTQKVAIISQMMAFTPAEAAKFWPIYDAYSAELAQLADRRVALIQDYANHFSSLSDAKADEIAMKALELESARTALRKKYYGQASKALSPKTAARFLQVENQLQLLLDLQISASLPIVE